MGTKEDFIKRNLYGSIAQKPSTTTQNKQYQKPVVGRIKHGKRVVYVTSYFNAAQEEEKKWKEKGFQTEIKKEKDDTGKNVFVVYVFE
jgi:hypothetical protein